MEVLSGEGLANPPKAIGRRHESATEREEEEGERLDERRSRPPNKGLLAKIRRKKLNII